MFNTLNKLTKFIQNKNLVNIQGESKSDKNSFYQLNQIETLKKDKVVNIVKTENDWKEIVTKHKTLQDKHDCRIKNLLYNLNEDQHEEDS